MGLRKIVREEIQRVLEQEENLPREVQDFLQRVPGAKEKDVTHFSVLQDHSDGKLYELYFDPSTDIEVPVDNINMGSYNVEKVAYYQGEFYIQFWGRKPR